MVLKAVDHNYSQLAGYHAGVDNLLSYQKKVFIGYGANKKFKITKEPLIDHDGYFLTGLLPRVMQADTFDLIDDRKYPPTEFRVPKLTDELRDYQVEYLIELLKRCRCIVKAPTGAGKTIIIAATIAAFNMKTVVITPFKDVMLQLTVELKRLLPEHMRVSNTLNHAWDVLVTLPGRVKNVPTQALHDTQVLIMDEAHGAGAPGAMEAILQLNTPYRYGFTATPTGRSDNRDLVVEGLFGEILEIVDHEDLVEQGFLPKTQVDIYSASFDGNYVLMEDLLIVNNTKRNQMIAGIANEHAKRNKGEVVLVLVRRVEHGKILADMISKAVYIDGSTPSNERTKVKEEAKKGKISVIVATSIFAQGIDIPAIITLGINAAGGKSGILSSQRFGRVTRPFGGNVKKWVDFIDAYTRTLENHSRERMHVYTDKSKNIRLIGFSDAKKEDLMLEYGI